jgi:integrase
MAGKRANGEGSIYQQSDHRWVGAITLPSGERKRYYGKTRHDVHDRLTQAL